MGARRGAGRSAARGRTIRADDCEKAACSTSAARGCSILDRGCSAGHTSQTRAGVGAPGGPRGEMRTGTVLGVGRRLPVAGGRKPATAAVVSARRRPGSRGLVEYYVRSYSGPDMLRSKRSGLDGAREDLGLGVLLAVDLLVTLLVVLLGVLRAIFTLVVFLRGVLRVLGLVLVVLGLGVLLLLLLDGLLLLRATRV